MLAVNVTSDFAEKILLGRDCLRTDELVEEDELFVEDDLFIEDDLLEQSTGGPSPRSRQGLQ